MTFWSTHSLAISVVATGALMLCVRPVSAQGGDKIEFSRPNVSMGVPMVERPDKDNNNFEFRSPAPAATDDFVPAYDTQEDAQVVVVSKPKKDSSSSDSRYADDPDDLDEAGPYSQDDNLYASPRAAGVTNSWDSQQGWDAGVARRNAEKSGDEAMRQDDLHSQMEAITTTDKTGYEQDERFSKKWAEQDQGTPWTRKLFHFGLPSASQSTAQQFMPSYRQMKLLNDAYFQVSPMSDLSGKAEDLSTNSGESSAATDSSFQDDLARRNSVDEASSRAVLIYRPVETKTQSRQSSSYSSPDNSSSYRGQAWEQPAVLRFPKRPGDVLK